MTDLDKLIDAVEGGDIGKTEDVARMLWPNLEGFRLEGNALHVVSAFSGSLDAAKALHVALLPGWLHHTGWTQGVPTIFATVWHPREEWEEITSTGPHEARAWLLSILKAYRSTQV